MDFRNCLLLFCMHHMNQSDSDNDLSCDDVTVCIDNTAVSEHEFWQQDGGRSGLVVACLPVAQGVLGSNLTAGESLCFHENDCDTQLWAWAACTLTAVPSSTQPSTLRGTVNEYQPYG